ncbi:MAG: DNA-binding protein [Comamonadaceae bacterium]|nr:DNA-binding protein [Comamonadaceae bacterium]
MNKLRTPDEAKAWLAYQGISAAEFCREHRLPTSLVYEILNGRKRCLRGMSHNIAVLLGMKAGVVTTRPARVAGAPRNSGAVQAEATAASPPKFTPTRGRCH